MIRVSRTNPMTGLLHEMELPITAQEYWDGNAKREDGVYIQDAFPQLSADEREFLISGMLPDDFNAMFPEE